MTCYVVTFEVSSSTRAQVIAQLKSFGGGYCPVHANCWAITTDMTASQIRDQILAVIGATDRLFVVRSGTEAAWAHSYGENNSTWLKNNL
jgi:hypothetical protein